jgi:hypothetical protein
MKMKKASTPVKTQPVQPAVKPVAKTSIQTFLPYIFPAIVLVILLFLAYRWYSVRTQRDGKVSPFADSVTIENLSQDDAKRILRGVGDLKTVQLTGQGDVSGQVRYEIKDGKVNFSVMAELPTLETGVYQVWIKEVGSDAKKQAFTLEEGKGGYIGSASVAETTLPFMILVTQGDQTILSGQVSK